MRRFLIAALIATTIMPAMPVLAQDRPDPNYRDDRGPPDGRRDPRRDHRDHHGRGPRDARYDDRGGPPPPPPGPPRDWHRYRGYDYNRFEPGQRTYHAERYYRDGRYYQPRRLGRADRIYRGGDNRYYCRRSDGTTGLIIGGLAGGLLGNVIAGGGSRTLGTLLGAGGGAALGRSIDRGQVICR